MSEMQDAHIRWAHHRLRAAELLLGHDFTSDAVSRTYFAVFEAARALLALRGEQPETHRPETHRGVSIRLHHHFRDEVQTATLSRLQQDREGADYRMETPNKEEVRAGMAQARRFIQQAERIIASEAS